MILLPITKPNIAVQTLSTTYNIANKSKFLATKFPNSNVKEEKVVNPPRKPVAKNSLIVEA